MIELNLPQRMLFALLRAAIGRTAAVPDCFQQATAQDWKECYQLAVSQGVAALAWDGLNTLTAELMPERQLKLSWGLTVEKHTRYYKRHCRTIEQLSRYYARHGIRTVQLKGVGLSTKYPIPPHREGGDIDIYTFSATDRMTNAEANHLADELMSSQGIDVDTTYPKHSFFYYQGIPIENHKTFVNVKAYAKGHEIEEVLHELLHPVEVWLEGGQTPVLVPSAAFNRLFLAYHASQHLGSGLALHHLCDWAVLLNNHGPEIPHEADRLEIRRFIEVLTHLSHQLLGTDPEAPQAADLADVVLKEILHPAFTKEIPATTPWGILVYKTRRMLYHHRLINHFLQSPMRHRLWSSIVYHWQRPKTILSR